MWLSHNVVFGKSTFQKKSSLLGPAHRMTGF